MAGDPYSILGVSRNASEEEIKKAYKKLSRLYHPDANVNNPNKDQAEEKFKEMQAAYQQIMKERTEGYPFGGSNASGYAGNAYSGRNTTGYGGYGNFYGGFGGYGQGQNNGYEEEPRLRAAGNYLRNGYYKEARTTLDSMGEHEKNATWFYYSAITNSGLGNNVAALEHARKAATLEPNNMDYRRLVSQLESGGQWYQQRQATYGYPHSGGSNVCMKLCIANLICNFCCGGSGMFCGPIFWC